VKALVCLRDRGCERRRFLGGDDHRYRKRKKERKKEKKRPSRLLSHRRPRASFLIRQLVHRVSACPIRKWLTRHACFFSLNIHDMAQPQMVVQPPPDPVLQAVIDADFKSVNLKLGGPDGSLVLSGANSEEVDEENGLDFTGLNRVSKLLAANPNLRCPPPPTVVSQKLSQVINGTKEEGNVRLSLLCHVIAVRRLSFVPRPCSKPKSTG
jgi:hypothetical protein